MRKTIALISALLLTTLAYTPQAVAATKGCVPTQAIEEGPYYLPNTPTRSDVTDG